MASWRCGVAGAHRWQMFAKCVPRHPTVAICSRDAFPGGNPWQFLRSMYPKRGLGREKRPFLARFAPHASKTSWLWQDMRVVYPKSPANRLLGMHRAKILPGRGAFRCTDPLNHARRANLAIRRRTARAIASTAPPLWRGNLPRDGRTGRGRLLVGRGGAAKGVRGVVGRRALAAKPAFAGRVQGGAAARRRLSSGPAE